MAMAVAALLLAGSVWADVKPPKTLKAGTYTAHVTALVCDGCAENIQGVLKSFKGVDGVAIDQAKSTLRFSVKKGRRLSVARLQKALKASSDEMGMGADYTLKDIELVADAAAAPAPAPAAAQ